MRIHLLIKRYTLGLVNALKDEREYAMVSQDLAQFFKLLSSHKELAGLLASPFIQAKKKYDVIKEVLAASSFAEKTSRFILLLMEHKRLNLLPDILQTLPVFWQEKKGVATFEVSSVVALSEGQKERLKKQLEQLEKKRVYLRYKIDSDLIAGLFLKKGNIVYDASVKGHLEKLKEKIGEG